MDDDFFKKVLDQLFVFFKGHMTPPNDPCDKLQGRVVLPQ